MEEKTLTFEEKLEKLLELARKKKNVLEQKEIIDFFHGEILSPEQLDQIDEYLEKNRLAIVETTSIKTDYTMIRPNEYLATGCIYERGSKLLEVSLNVTSEEEAVDVCRRFKEKNEDVYAQLLSMLCME